MRTPTLSLLSLPDELLEPIAALVAGRGHRSADAARLASTCRRLHRIAMPLAFQSLAVELGFRQFDCGPSVPPSRRQVEAQMENRIQVSDIISRYGSTVSALDLRLADADEDHSPQICEWLRQCSDLRNIHFEACHKLNGGLAYWEDIALILEAISSLRGDSLRKFSYTQNSVTQPFISHHLVDILKHCRQLEAFNVISPLWPDPDTKDDLEPVLQQAHSLKKLYLYFFQGFAYPELNSALPVPPLTTISLIVSDRNWQTVYDLLSAVSATLRKAYLFGSSPPNHNVLPLVLPHLDTLILHSNLHTLGLIDPRSPVVHTNLLDIPAAHNVEPFYAGQPIKTWKSLSIPRGRNTSTNTLTAAEQKQKQELQDWTTSRGILLSYEKFNLGEFTGHDGVF
ncbi:hypothetical protein JCM10908_006862 [Rhodotorula pacifica]|uniref:uncharacterized protein n=1 Tax=Rhodotorula pacifica TaxID=1495444 RepID=UPI00317956D1